jgi:L-amino acid N-acyltransferase YncA
VTESHRLNLCPITLKDACAFVARTHRHHKPPQGGLFAVAVALSGEIVGVAIVGRPVARMLSDGWTAEVIRLSTDGSKNACSILYAAAWRACRALGYRRLITYILNTEPGTSLRAAGWKLIGQAGGGSWHREDRPRIDEHPTQGKLRFEMSV